MSRGTKRIKKDVSQMKLHDRIGNENFESLLRSENKDKSIIEKDSVQDKANEHIKNIHLKPFKDKKRFQ